MHMSFWWDFKVNNYLFKGLSTSSIGGLILICLCAAAMSFSFEFLRYLQARQRQKELTLRSEQLKTICPTETSTLLTEGEATTATADQKQDSVTVLDRTFLFAAEISIWFVLQNLGYILMLSVMLYNGWIFVSAVIGGGLGYFVFGQLFMKINLQNCQIIRDTWCMQKCGEPETFSTNRDGESTPALEVASTSRVLSCHQVTASVHTE